MDDNSRTIHTQINPVFNDLRITTWTTEKLDNDKAATSY
jgi:hypothetical protein